MQQRAIPPFIVDLIMDFGARLRSAGADVFYIDKDARKRLRRELAGDRALRVIEPWLGAYVVVGDDGAVVTVGHRTRRLKEGSRWH